MGTNQRPAQINPHSADGRFSEYANAVCPPQGVSLGVRPVRTEPGYARSQRHPAGSRVRPSVAFAVSSERAWRSEARARVAALHRGQTGGGAGPFGHVDCEHLAIGSCEVVVGVQAQPVLSPAGNFFVGLSGSSNHSAAKRVCFLFACGTQALNHDIVGVGV